MADRISKEKRSWNMRQIKGRNTKPEILVRSVLHRAGYRFTVNGPKNKALPGRPDIVLPKYKTVIFVHGCFWHRHENCKRAATPKSNKKFWLEKFERNVKRDEKNLKDLKNLGWNVITIWECELKEQEKVIEIIEQQLNTKSSPDIVEYKSDAEKLPVAAEKEINYEQ